MCRFAQTDLADALRHREYPCCLCSTCPSHAELDDSLMCCLQARLSAIPVTFPGNNVTSAPEGVSLPDTFCSMRLMEEKRKEDGTRR